MKKRTLFLGLGALVLLVLAFVGVMGWLLDATQVQATGLGQCFAAQHPYVGCSRHGAGMMAVGSPAGNAAGCPMQGQGGCPQHSGTGCPMQGQGEAGGCPMQGQTSPSGCPMQGGEIK